MVSEDWQQTYYILSISRSSDVPKLQQNISLGSRIICLIFYWNTPVYGDIVHTVYLNCISIPFIYHRRLNGNKKAWIVWNYEGIPELNYTTEQKIWIWTEKKIGLYIQVTRLKKNNFSFRCLRQIYTTNCHNRKRSLK